MVSYLTILIAIPLAALIVLAVTTERRAGPEETAPRRVFLLLEITTLVLLALNLVVERIPAVRDQLYWVVQVLIPLIFALVLLLLAQIPQFGRLARRDRWVVAGLGLLILGVLGYAFLGDPSGLLMALPGVIACLAAAWLINAQPARWVWILPVVAVLMWAVHHSRIDSMLDDLPAALAWGWRVIYLVGPFLSVAVIALFSVSGLRMLFAAAGPEQPRFARVEGLLRLLTALLLLGVVVYSVVWASIWDKTSDGLGGLMIAGLTTVTAIGCGVLIGVRSRGRQRWIGLVFALVVAVSVQIGFNAGWGVSFPTLTEQRAGRVARALEAFHQREQRYPQELSQLVPRDLLVLPGPVMFRSEDWCYQGGAQAYRLTAFAHEYFGMPVSLQVYASAGDTGDQPLPCQERLAAMQERYDWTRSIPEAAWNPTPDPALSSGVEREPLEPVYASPKRILPGSWSPDGQWWFFREVDADNQQVRLVFLNASGRVCLVDQVFVYSMFNDDGAQSVWLDSRRLLYLDGSQQPPIFTPCEARVRLLELPPGVILTRVHSAAAKTARVLLQSKDAFWLLDYAAAQVRQIPGVQPVPYDAHWDRAAWDPTGERLAIAHLNSREPKDGITLYLIDAAQNQVISSQVMDLASQQSAPWIEWVSSEALLVSGPESMLLLNMTTTPVQPQDVVRDLFKLRLKYPNQMHSSASLAARDGSAYHLMIWANLPGDQRLYLYHSENGQVSVYQPRGAQVVLRFSDGQSMRLFRLEDNPTADRVTFYAVDGPDASPLEVAVSGHLPRGYPMLEVQPLPGAERLLASSSNGVSLISLPGGEQLHFWQTGSSGEPSPMLLLSPDGSTAFTVAAGEGVYQIPLP